MGLSEYKFCAAAAADDDDDDDDVGQPSSVKYGQDRPALVCDSPSSSSGANVSSQDRV